MRRLPLLWLVVCWAIGTGCGSRGGEPEQALAWAQAETARQRALLVQQQETVTLLRRALLDIAGDDAQRIWSEQAEVVAGAGEVPEAQALLGRVMALGGPLAESARARCAELDVVGEQAPSLEGVRWANARRRQQDHMVWVLWELSCPECRQELPGLATLADRWAPEGVEVVVLTTMSQGAKEAELSNLLRRSDISVPVGIIEPTAYDSLAVISVPTAALVTGGVVTWRGGLGELEAVLREQANGP